MKILINEEYAGLTIKEWLYKNHISRGLITHLKKRADGITVNGEHVTVRYVLKIGDTLNIAADDRCEDENEFLVPTKMELDILYEDDDIVAVNKPFGMATHPSLGHFEDTLANGLAYYYSSRGIPFVFRAVNRLDRDTSGAVLVAKNRMSAASLTALMQSGKIRKQYIAVLNGRIEPPHGEINASIRRQTGTIMLREVCCDGADGSKPALTLYKTLLSCSDASVVQAEPVTGRTHQLRVHFAHMGCPIVGDGFYGSAETTPTEYDKRMTRQALHASSLKIDFGDRVLNITAGLPRDMAELKSFIEETRARD